MAEKPRGSDTQKIGEQLNKLIETADDSQPAEPEDSPAAVPVAESQAEKDKRIVEGIRKYLSELPPDTAEFSLDQVQNWLNAHSYSDVTPQDIQRLLKDRFPGIRAYQLVDPSIAYSQERDKAANGGWYQIINRLESKLESPKGTPEIPNFLRMQVNTIADLLQAIENFYDQGNELTNTLGHAYSLEDISDLINRVIRDAVATGNRFSTRELQTSYGITNNGHLAEAVSRLIPQAIEAATAQQISQEKQRVLALLTGLVGIINENNLVLNQEALRNVSRTILQQERTQEMQELINTLFADQLIRAEQQDDKLIYHVIDLNRLRQYFQEFQAGRILSLKERQNRKGCAGLVAKIGRWFAQTRVGKKLGELVDFIHVGWRTEGQSPAVSPTVEDSSASTPTATETNQSAVPRAERNLTTVEGLRDSLSQEVLEATDENLDEWQRLYRNRQTRDQLTDQQILALFLFGRITPSLTRINDPIEGVLQRVHTFEDTARRLGEQLQIERHRQRAEQEPSAPARTEQDRQAAEQALRALLGDNATVLQSSFRKRLADQDDANTRRLNVLLTQNTLGRGLAEANLDTIQELLHLILRLNLTLPQFGNAEEAGNAEESQAAIQRALENYRVTHQTIGQKISRLFQRQTAANAPPGEPKRPSQDEEQKPARPRVDELGTALAEVLAADQEQVDQWAENFEEGNFDDLPDNNFNQIILMLYVRGRAEWNDDNEAMFNDALNTLGFDRQTLEALRRQEQGFNIQALLAELKTALAKLSARRRAPDQEEEPEEPEPDDEENVAELAEEMGMPVERLLDRLRALGNLNWPTLIAHLGTIGARLVLRIMTRKIAVAVAGTAGAAVAGAGLTVASHAALAREKGVAAAYERMSTHIFSGRSTAENRRWWQRTLDNLERLVNTFPGAASQIAFGLSRMRHRCSQRLMNLNLDQAESFTDQEKLQSQFEAWINEQIAKDNNLNEVFKLGQDLAQLMHLGYGAVDLYYGRKNLLHPVLAAHTAENMHLAHQALNQAFRQIAQNQESISQELLDKWIDNASTEATAQVLRHRIVAALAASGVTTAVSSGLAAFGLEIGKEAVEFTSDRFAAVQQATRAVQTEVNQVTHQLEVLTTEAKKILAREVNQRLDWLKRIVGIEESGAPGIEVTPPAEEPDEIGRRIGPRSGGLPRHPAGTPPAVEPPSGTPPGIPPKDVASPGEDAGSVGKGGIPPEDSLTKGVNPEEAGSLNLVLPVDFQKYQEHLSPVELNSNHPTLWRLVRENLTKMEGPNDNAGAGVIVRIARALNPDWDPNNQAAEVNLNFLNQDAQLKVINAMENALKKYDSGTSYDDLTRLEQILVAGRRGVLDPTYNNEEVKLIFDQVINRD